MAGLHEIGVRRAKSLQHTLDLLGLKITVPSTKAAAVEQLAFEAELFEAMAETLALLERNQEELFEAYRVMQNSRSRKAD
jgi:hypothetical protein